MSTETTAATTATPATTAVPETTTAATTSTTTTTPSSEATTPAPDTTAPAAKAEGMVNPASESLFAKKEEADGDTKTDVEPDKKEGDADGEADKEGEKPIEYSDFTMPEGFTPDAELLGKFKDVASKGKVAQEQAQEFVSLFADHQKKVLDNYVQERRGWRDEVKNDPELGGHNLKGTLNNIEALVQKYSGGDPKVLEGMQENLIYWGMGDRLSFLKFMNNIHRATSEDKADGKPGSNVKPEKSMAQSIWGNMPGDKAE